VKEGIYSVAGRRLASSIIGRTDLSSLKYLRTVIPLWVIAYTTRFLPIVRSSTRFCWIRKLRYCFRTLQFTLALYMMWVSLSGPRWDRTLRISMYISSLERRMFKPL
jgi:hypothetical protein